MYLLSLSSAVTPLRPWACSVIFPRTVAYPLFTAQWWWGAPQDQRLLLPLPALPEPSLQHLYPQHLKFLLDRSAAPPTPHRLKTGPPLTLASNILEIVSTSICCHLTVTMSALSLAQGSRANPGSLLAVSFQVVLPGSPPWLFCRWGHLPPTSPCLPSHPHKPRMASTVPPLSTSMEPEQTK